MKPDPHIPVPHRTPLAIVDLKVRRIGVQGEAQNEILHNGQSSPVDAPGQFLVVTILRKDFHPLDSRVSAGDIPDGYQQCQRCAVRAVDGAVAHWRVYPCGGAGFHGVLRCVVGAVEAAPEDGTVGTLVVAVGTNGVDEDIGGCTCAAPDVGKITRRVCSR